MAVNGKDIFIVGCGPGGVEYITPAAQSAAKRADVLVGASRLLEMFPGCGRERIVVAGHIEGFLTRMESLLREGRRVTVLVSGDPGLFSLSKNVIGRFGRDRCEVIPAISSVQVAFSRLGLAWEDARIISAHGRTPVESAADLGRWDKLALLAGTNEALQWAGEAAAKHLPGHELYLCENLTLPNERVVRVAAADLTDCHAGSLAIVLMVRRELLS